MISVTINNSDAKPVKFGDINIGEGFYYYTDANEIWYGIKTKINRAIILHSIDSLILSELNISTSYYGPDRKVYPTTIELTLNITEAPKNLSIAST